MNRSGALPNYISKKYFVLQQFHNWSKFIRSKNFDGTEAHEMQSLRVVDDDNEDVPIDEEDEDSF